MRTKRLFIRPLLLVVPAVVFGCEPRATTAVDGPTPEKVVDEPARYLGQEISLSGEVDDVYGQRAFELEGTKPFFDEELLVLTKSPVAISGAALRNNDHVVVTGTVREFSSADLNRELGWEVSAELDEEWRDKPVIVAKSIVRADAARAWREDRVVGPPEIAFVSVYLSADPAGLAGQEIHIIGANVRSTAGKGLWIGNTERSQMYVVPTDSEAPPSILPGDRVDVRGKLRMAPSNEAEVRALGFDEATTDPMAGEALYIEASSLRPHPTTIPPATTSSEPPGSAPSDPKAPALEQGSTREASSTREQRPTTLANPGGTPTPRTTSTVPPPGSPMQ